MCFGRHTWVRPISSFLGVSLYLKKSLKTESWLLAGLTDPVCEKRQKLGPPTRHLTSLLLPWGVAHISEAGLELSFGSGQGAVTGHDPWPLGKHWEAVSLRVLGVACMALYRRRYTDSVLWDYPLTVFMDASPHRIRRTQSGNFNTDAPGMAEFRRGGLRATAGPRLSRTRDAKGQKR